MYTEVYRFSWGKQWGPELKLSSLSSGAPGKLCGDVYRLEMECEKVATNAKHVDPSSQSTQNQCTV